MKKLINKIIQFKNLELIIAGVLVLWAIILADPLGYCSARRQYRANIENQIAIARAETQHKIAVIKAQIEAELLRIKSGGYETTKN